MDLKSFWRCNSTSKSIEGKRKWLDRKHRDKGRYRVDNKISAFDDTGWERTWSPPILMAGNMKEKWYRKTRRVSLKEETFKFQSPSRHSLIQSWFQLTGVDVIWLHECKSLSLTQSYYKRGNKPCVACMREGDGDRWLRLDGGGQLEIDASKLPEGRERKDDTMDLHNWWLALAFRQARLQCLRGLDKRLDLSEVLSEMLETLQWRTSFCADLFFVIKWSQWDCETLIVNKSYVRVSSVFSGSCYQYLDRWAWFGSGRCRSTHTVAHHRSTSLKLILCRSIWFNHPKVTLQASSNARTNLEALTATKTDATSLG
jgi:hypothetical protein